MDARELKKSTDKSSSSDEAETNNGGFPQWIRDIFPYLPGTPDKGKNERKKSTQSRQKSLYRKGSKCSVAVQGKKRQTEPKMRHPDIKKSSDLLPVFPRSKSTAPSVYSDDESDVEDVADHNRKYAMIFNKTSPYSLPQFFETLMRDDRLNRERKKQEKLKQTLLQLERLEPNTSKEEFNTSRLQCLGDHVVPSTSFSDSHAVPSTSFSESHAVPSTSFSDSHAVPSTSFSDCHAVPSTSFSDSHVVPSTSFSDSHVVPSINLSEDILGVPSTNLSEDILGVPSTNLLEDILGVSSTNLSEEIFANIEHPCLIDTSEDLDFENFDNNNFVDVNELDISDYESATETTHYTHTKRKLPNKSHGHYKHDIEFKKSRVESPISSPPFKDYSSEEDIQTYAKEELKFSASSEDDKR